MRIRGRYFGLTGDANFPAADGRGRYRSQLVRRGCIHLLLDPLVGSFRLGEPRVRFCESGGGTRYFTGDVLVCFVAGLKRRPLVISYCARDAREEGATELPSQSALARALDQSGRDYRVLSRGDVENDELDMKEFVCGYLNNAAMPVEEELLNVIRSHRKIVLRQLITAVATGEAAQFHLIAPVWRLVATKRAFIDFRCRATLETEIHSVPLCRSPFL